jgi:hypothetical protein
VDNPEYGFEKFDMVERADRLSVENKSEVNSRPAIEKERLL